jgi:hypothetical protein
MTSTIVSTLAALRNVGKAPVTVRLNPELFPIDALREAVVRHADALSLDDTGHLTVEANGQRAEEALREFAQDLLRAALQRE